VLKAAEGKNGRNIRKFYCFFSSVSVSGSSAFLRLRSFVSTS
jgi:hypothetical protein